MKAIALFNVFFILAMSLNDVHANIYTTKTWKKNEIVVCFGDDPTDDSFTTDFSIKTIPWKKKQIAQIRSWVEKDFSIERTGIHFTGWNNCKDQIQFDLVILKSNVSNFKFLLFGGTAGAVKKIGEGTELIKQYYPATNAVFIADATIDRWTVIHEFGHIAGLAHEHDHPQAKCHMTKVKLNYGSNFVYEDFDPDSVMNYCSRLIKDKESRKNKTDFDFYLSNQEASLLKRLYP